MDALTLTDMNPDTVQYLDRLKEQLGGVMSKRILRFPAVLAVFIFVSPFQTAAVADLVPITTCSIPAGCPGGPLGTPTEGWDGAGLGAVTIDYFVGNPGQPNNGIPTGPGGVSIGLAAFDAAITAAQAVWSAVVQVDWNRLGDAVSDAIDWTIDQSVIYAAPGDHSDGNAFDGAWNPDTGTGNVLAHAFGPPDISVGNLHLDNDEMWVTSGAAIGTTSATIDLVSILAHEFGHVLGLGHPGSNSGDVMQPLYFGPLTTLSADDITAVRSLYACRGEGCEDPNGGGDPTDVPEPGTLLLFATGLLGFAFSRKRLTA